jgi:hypothetical protein
MTEAASPDAWTLHEAEQRRAWLRLTHEERFRWLIQAKRFAAIALAAARERDQSASDRRRPGA